MNKVFQLSVCLIPLLLPAILPGQSLSDAVRLSHEGKHAEAEAVFSMLQDARPNDAAAALARAFNKSWMGSQKEAIAGFEGALRLGAEEVSVLSGLGYAAAWSRDFARAKQSFSRVLELDPGNEDATKGLAFTHLWQGNHVEAIRLFDELLVKTPDAYDLNIGKGLAHLGNAEHTSARIAFERALAIDPASEEAKELIQKAPMARPSIEGDVWLGFTQLGENENRAGLRGLQLTAQMGKFTRAWAKYDNTLALDILQFARSGKAAPFLAAGMSRQWNTRLISELEYGVRIFDDNQIQHLISGAQVFFLPNNIRIKAGAFAGFGSNANSEWMAYGSFNVPAGKRFRIEPTYYYISPDAGSREHRVQLGLQYRSPRDWELNFYGLYGQTRLEGLENSGDIYGWSISGLYPFGKRIAAQWILRQEQSLFYRFTSAAAGVKIRMYR